MNKFEKYYNLHRALSDRQKNPNLAPARLSVLLRLMSCSEATFHRIRMEMVEIMGAPIVCTQGVYSYQQDSKFELPGLWLSQDEIAAMAVLSDAIENLKPVFLGDQMLPLKEWLKKTLEERGIAPEEWSKRIRLKPMRERPLSAQVFATISSGVIRREKLTIMHERGDGTEQTRTISPQSLVRYRDNWYLDAHCDLRQEMRTFSLNQIKSVERLENDKALFVEASVLEKWMQSQYGIFKSESNNQAVVRFTRAAARYAVKEIWHPDQQMTVGTNFVTLTIPYGNSQELLGDILRWGPDAEVLSPDSLRSEAKLKLLETLKAYN